MRLYEGLFVIDAAIAERNYDDVCAEIESTITKHGGKVVDLRKWDERRLAYDINKARRATYVLVHFETPPESIAELRRDFVLSENILRQLLVIDADGVPTGDERPGITNSISEASHRRRSSRSRRSRKEEEKDEGEEEGKEDEGSEEGETADEEAGAGKGANEEAGDDGDEAVGEEDAGKEG